MSEAADIVERAEQRIALILAELERQTGSVVRRIELDDIEITTMDDERRQLLRRVNINMERLPGTRWQAEPN